MAVLLYTYRSNLAGHHSVTSISAAKRNAALHRHADGGQLDMRRESLRRHGVLDQVEGTKGVELFRNARAPAANSTSTSTSTAVGAGAGAGTTNSSAPTPVPEAVHGPDLSSPPPPPAEQKQTKNAPTGEEAVRGSGAGGQQPERAARTEVEGGLEGWKGEGGRGRFRGPPPPSA
ncbi:uncharacterized protein HMPREF1541_01667 [Cyphellophora europaea CBS 101466]|uniref:Uncharacterized protein n=1 Tax=Cyphellophora europaea (strain CBS 101466) TaxID=1220924 RepID=W2S1Q0_CYPE1|nr:uncharacterized protein HMPREF1541_01667 [Cyphellophora europaea CBS 101466]ETN42510.1 hypothetical protein HMPREF1541_01667 [Cyphellophora europaea CBS 101466]